jgi:hypothetical protein
VIPARVPGSSLDPRNHDHDFGIIFGSKESSFRRFLGVIDDSSPAGMIPLVQNVETESRFVRSLQIVAKMIPFLHRNHKKGGICRRVEIFKKHGCERLHRSAKKRKN